MAYAGDVKLDRKLPSLNDTISINEVVVTGSRIPTKKSNVAQRIELVSKRQIELMPAKDLTSAIKGVTGVNIIDYGGMLSGISIRGFRPEFDNLSGRSTVMVNGRPAAGGNLALLDIANAERIEVLRGPASSIYGPTAMGGVVNIITKKSDGKLSGRVEAGLGNFGYNTFGGTIGGAIAKSGLDFDLNASREARGNFKTGDGNLFRGLLGGGQAQFKTSSVVNGAIVDKYEMRDDKRGDGEKIDYSKYGRTTYGARVGYQIAPEWKMNFYYDGSYAGDVESPADITKMYMPTKKSLDRNALDFTVDGKAGSFDIFARAYYGNQTSNSIEVFDWQGNKLPDEYTSYKGKFDWKGVQLNTSTSYKMIQTTVGVDYNVAGSYSHRFDATGTELEPYNLNYTLGTFGIYNQTKASLLGDKLLGTLGLRYDINDYETKTSSFDPTKQGSSKNINFFSPSLGLKYKITDDLHLNATFGRAFSYANPYHLTGYWEKASASDPNSISIDIGNPNLKNQESNTWDGGFSYANAIVGLSFEATYFNTTLKNSSVSKAYYVQSADFEDNLKKLGIAYTKDGSSYKTLQGKTIMGVSSYVNAYKSYIDGLELNLNYDFGSLANNRFSLLAHVGYVQMLKMDEQYTNSLGETDTRNIYNVAKSTINFGLSYDSHKRFSVGFSGRYLGYRYDNDWSDWMNPAEVRYPQVLVMDVFAKMKIVKGFSCTVFVNNITDENYYEKRDYNMPGINYNLKVAYEF